ncbi:hypothetical protein KO506_09370 [Polaribacter vadi]|uniref:DUF6503 family protein n=1 Tax=Polaribacter TaxID=52959 RepID=UPI001C0A2D51|nr:MULTISPECIES: DUF6503 family protein [Polaribacter]MBU3011611.1 hypothetical protein [Polaribacter vadi]MDO6741424.1 DUF6503 family protein [Polaribacter sp. 1_MG-2023]
MKNLLTFLVLFVSITLFSQEITGDELLTKAIQFHDPNGNWETFKGELFVIMETPKNGERKSKINIDLPKQYFSVVAKRDTIITEFIVDKDSCSFSLNGKQNLSAEIKKKFSLNCERANLYKNYYTYLYGLPMKLKDDGTVIHQKVEKRQFKGKDYLVLKATYNKEVGKDTWYFYFNPDTYAMEVYQFFKEAKDSGEYILLSGLETINQVKMPKIRAWYYNKDNKYLGTDILSIKK